MILREFPKHQTDVIIQRYQSGEGCKRISKKLNIPWNTVKTIIIKWRKYGPTVTLPRTGHPSKIVDKVRKKLVREAGKRPTLTLKKLQEFLASTGCVNVHINKNVFYTDFNYYNCHGSWQLFFHCFMSFALFWMFYGEIKYFCSVNCFIKRRKKYVYNHVKKKKLWWRLTCNWHTHTHTSGMTVCCKYILNEEICKAAWLWNHI